jgi:hypothetical protein
MRAMRVAIGEPAPSAATFGAITLKADAFTSSTTTSFANAASSSGSRATGAAALTLDSGTACLSIQALAEAIDALRERECEDDARDKLNIEILEGLFQTLRLAHLKGPDIVYDGRGLLARRTDA